MFYISTTIIPITLLAVISSAATILPAMTGDRIALLISCMLATIVYLDTLFKYLPESSRSFPLIFLWVLLNLVSTTLQIVLACICLNWANKEEKKKKPGRGIVVAIFYLVRYTVLFVPYLCHNIYKCAKNRRSKIHTADTTIEEPTELQQQGQEANTNQHPAATEDQKEIQEYKKTFKNAVKIVDWLAMILSVASLAVIPLLFWILWMKPNYLSLCTA